MVAYLVVSIHLIESVRICAFKSWDFRSSISLPFLQQFQSLIPPHDSSIPHSRSKVSECLPMIRSPTTLTGRGSSHFTVILGPRRTGHIFPPRPRFPGTHPISVCLPSTMAHPTIRCLSPPHLSLRRLSIPPPTLPMFPMRRPIPTLPSLIINNLRTIIFQVPSMPLARQSRR